MRTLFKTDGTFVELPARVSHSQISELIGATTLDLVNRVIDGRHVMFVDDRGHHKGLPLNVKGTGLYHARCRTGSTPPQIVGDVVVVPMADYGD